MSVTTKKYTSPREEEVHAIKVTLKNARSVAEWSGAVLKQNNTISGSVASVAVNVRQNGGTKIAAEGDYVVKDGDSFYVEWARVFEERYSEVKETKEPEKKPEEKKTPAPAPEKKTEAPKPKKEEEKK